ncbi:MAG: hypothetical protein AB7U05_07495 [Mangrovibacterium sp.]
MKKLYLLVLSFLVIAISAHAQTVALHQTDGPQLFYGLNAFTDACNAAATGDTIYLSGHGFNTSNISLDKKLLVYGAGHYPDSTTVTGKTTLTGSINLSENADGFYIEGVDMTGGITTTSNHAVDQITIKYCRLQGELNIRGDRSTPSLNLMLVNCAMKAAVRLTNAQNAGIFNSIFNADIVDTYGNLFQNNIFLLNNWSSTTYRYTLVGDNNTLENNIFIRTADREVAGNNNTIKNNITPKTDPFWGNTPIATGNYTGVAIETIFVNQTGNVFDYTHDYHLQAPATYLGVDGTQVGIYGNAYPYKEGAVPSNPHFVTGTVAPQTDADGKLNIVIKVTAQDR